HARTLSLHDALPISMSYAAQLAHLWRSRGFRALTRMRVLGQAGDGAFQFGIATAFFFDPTHATTPRDIAIGFATLFAPFTLVGPDRKSTRLNSSHVK